MAKEDTPPASPMSNVDEIIDEDEDELDEEGAIEVIELDDEELEFGDDDDGLETVEEEGSMIVQDVKDNSTFVFKEHTSKLYFSTYFIF